MSKYSIYLYEILIEYVSENENLTIDEVKLLLPYEICKKGRKAIFDFTYPIFSEDYRETLEVNFLMNFYVYEIGSETFNLFKQRLITDFITKMPYYNKLYESQLLDIEPLVNDQLEETYEREFSKTDTGNSVANSDTKTSTNNKNVYSDTPQGLLSGKDYATNVSVGDNGVVGESNQTGTTDSKSDSKESYKHSRKGNSGVSLSRLVMEYREILINVDLIIFSDMSDLFLLLY